MYELAAVVCPNALSEQHSQRRGRASHVGITPWVFALPVVVTFQPRVVMNLLVSGGNGHSGGPFGGLFGESGLLPDNHDTEGLLVQEQIEMSSDVA